jgi:hypothetical protein
MRTTLLASAASALFLLAATGPVAADGIKIGALRCNVAGGLGLIITSSKPMNCVFTSGRGYSEQYAGIIRKFGLDIGTTNRGILSWAVFAPAAGGPRGALSGDYAGVDASATVGAGVGANALVGGFDRSITLQPLSIQVQSGLALAAGVASLTLQPR